MTLGIPNIAPWHRGKLVLSSKDLVWSQGGPPSLCEASPGPCSIHFQWLLSDRLQDTQQASSCLRLTSPSRTPASEASPSPTPALPVGTTKLPSTDRATTVCQGLDTPGQGTGALP